MALEAALNKNQIEKLIKITRHCINGDDVFNLASHKEICEIWTDASAMVSPVSASYIFQAFPIFNNSLLKFTRYELTASHKGHELVFDFWCRSLWDWVLDLVGNPLLAPYFEWDAQKLFKHDGTNFVRFVDEPWTANRFWNVQVSLLLYLFFFVT